MKMVSLFSGAMGLDLGLERAGFEPLLVADNMDAAVQTIERNRPALKVFSGDITELSGSELLGMIGVRQGELDLLAGGPPCQSFSTAGKRKSTECARNGHLVFEFVRFVEELRPRAFVMENVKGILSASIKWRDLPYNNNGKKIDDLHGSLLRELLARFESLGYSVAYKVLNAADYGVPQVRERVFFLGTRDGSSPKFPDPSHSESGDLWTEPWVPIGEVLKGLRSDNSHRAQFSERKLKYLRMVPPGGNWRDLPVRIQRESMGRAYFAKGGRTGYWRRLSLSRPAPTILTEPNNASTSLCHPKKDRPLTVRECARIQTFPDSWVFCGRGAEQYRLVGNAVPPLLARKLGEALMQMLSEGACSRQPRQRVSPKIALGSQKVA